MSCLDEENPYIRTLLIQTCFTAQQSAQRLVNTYTKEEVLQRAKLRNIPSDLPLKQQRYLLQDRITREIYILEYTRMTQWSQTKLRRLATRLHIPTDTEHLAWMIAMVIVRDQIPYSFTSKKNIQLLK